MVTNLGDSSYAVMYNAVAVINTQNHDGRIVYTDVRDERMNSN